jgi:hypothetical protein
MSGVSFEKVDQSINKNLFVVHSTFLQNKCFAVDKGTFPGVGMLFSRGFTRLVVHNELYVYGKKKFGFLACF